MAKQEFNFYVEKENDGWYAYVSYPEEEGGSVERAGPFATEKEALKKMEDGMKIIKSFRGDWIKRIERIQ